MRQILRLFSAAALTFVSACGVEGTTSVQTVRAPLETVNGTELTASATWVVQCTGGATSNVLFGGNVITDGAVDSVAITAAIDGGAPTLVGTIQPQDFLHGQQNTKTAPFNVTLPLADGSYSVELCFDQSGSNGRPSKHFCFTDSNVVVDCADLTCDTMEPFGNLVGNPSLCRGKGPPHIPVHVRGDFGDAASLTISGPNGFSFTAAMRHAGDSCNYQFDWDAEGNGGEGTYAFRVEGNGSELVFSAQLHCGE